MNSDLYRIREAHEDVDRRIIKIVDDMVLQPKSEEQKLFQTLRVANSMSEITTRYTKLWDMYTDPNLLNSMKSLYPKSFMISNSKSEIDNESMRHALDNLEKEVDSIYDLYTRIGLDALSDPSTTTQTPDELLRSGSELSKFNGTENFGKFFDLAPIWAKLMSLYPPDIFPQIEYPTFLVMLAGMERAWKMPSQVTPSKMVVPDVKLPKKRHGNQTKHLSQQLPRCLKTKEYLTILDELFIYLLTYLQNLKPLANIEQLLLKSERMFELHWISGSWHGWLPHYNQPTDNELLEYYLSLLSNDQSMPNSQYPTQFEHLNNFEYLAKHLKHLQSRFKSQHIDKNSKYSLADVLTFQINNPLWTRIAKREALIQSLLEDELITHLLNTVHEIRRKQGMTEVEILKEQERVQAFADAGYEEKLDLDQSDLLEKNAQGGRIVYGEDGEPLDYWLYKLHGFHRWFVCEICGDEKYRGPRAFEAHFSQWRHTYSLQSVGITNSPEFTWVTKISEAKDLWNRLQQQKKLTGEWNPDDDEEFEDVDGNVYSKKVFDDLIRQGIIQAQS